MIASITSTMTQHSGHRSIHVIKIHSRRNRKCANDRQR